MPDPAMHEVDSGLARGNGYGAEAAGLRGEEAGGDGGEDGLGGEVAHGGDVEAADRLGGAAVTRDFAPGFRVSRRRVVDAR